MGGGRYLKAQPKQQVFVIVLGQLSGRHTIFFATWKYPGSEKLTNVYPRHRQHRSLQVLRANFSYLAKNHC